MIAWPIRGKATNPTNQSEPVQQRRATSAKRGKTRESLATVSFGFILVWLKQRHIYFDWFKETIVSTSEGRIKFETKEITSISTFD